MGLIKRLITQRAEVEAEALKRARQVCEEKGEKVNIRISGRMSEKEKAIQNFHVADSSGNINEANNLLRRIQAIQEDIENLYRDKESWGDLDNILFRMESLVFLLHQHGEHRVIVRALPYGRLKRENYSSETVENLRKEFEVIYEKLRLNAFRLAKQDVSFSNKLREINRNFSTMDEMERKEGNQSDVLDELRRKLRQERDEKVSSIEPVERTDSEKKFDVKKKNS